MMTCPHWTALPEQSLAGFLQVIVKVLQHLSKTRHCEYSDSYKFSYYSDLIFNQMEWMNQCFIKNLIHMNDFYKLQIIPYTLWNIIDILFIIFRNNNCSNPCTMSSQDLFFEPTYR